MNTTKATEFFKWANLVYFNSVLRPARLVKFGGPGIVAPDWPVAGWFDQAGPVIYYHRKLSTAKARATILHEMVHQWENEIMGIDFESPDAPDHGEFFRKWQAYFRREQDIEI